MSKNHLHDLETSASSRFSLILLEPDEIYFEDYLVYYNELNCPFNEGEETTPLNQLKGNLKICSKSFVFDPINLSAPLLKFPYKSIEKIVTFENDSETEDTDIYSASSSSPKSNLLNNSGSRNRSSSDGLRKKTFAIR